MAVGFGLFLTYVPNSLGVGHRIREKKELVKLMLPYLCFSSPWLGFSDQQRAYDSMNSGEAQNPPLFFRSL